MADWSQPFESAYRFVRVSRATGYETGEIDAIRGGSLVINRDTDTYESANVDTATVLDVGADLVRCYLDATFGDGSTESVCLGTWLPSVPSRDVDGAFVTSNAYLDGRLAELQDDSFEAAYSLPAGTNIVGAAAAIVTGAGLPVRVVASNATLGAPWVFGLEDEGEEDGGTKLQAVNALMRLAGYAAAHTDERGTVVLEPSQTVAGNDPVWTFREGLGATFLAKAEDERDTRDVANVVLAIYETEGQTTIGTAVDDDPASPYSTVTLGRRKVVKYRYNDTATQARANQKAAELLETNQSVIRRVTLSHVHNPARVGDVVSVDWPSAGISGAFIIRTQTVEIGSAGCLTTSELRRYERR